MNSTELNYYLYAIVYDGDSESYAGPVKTVQISAAVQDSIGDLFTRQASRFADSELQRIPFEGDYNLDKDEIFVIRDFRLPQEMLETANGPSQFDPLRASEDELLKIKAIFVTEYNRASRESALYFKAFDRGKVIRPKSALLFSRDTFQEIDETGLRIDSGIVATHKHGDLLFKSYTTVKKFLDITEYYKEATDNEIEDLLDHPSLDVDDAADVIGQAGPWHRKRYTSIIASKILDRVTPRAIKKAGTKFNLQVDLTRIEGKEKVSFPQKRNDLRAFLKLLNEEYFEGALTRDRFQTNTKRKLS